jgi:hypothetical protein
MPAMPNAEYVTDTSELVLWDVVEEHLDEAAFLVGQFERALEHPARLLSELDRYPEGRLRAHVDALAIGGAPVRERLLTRAPPDSGARRKRA